MPRPTRPCASCAGPFWRMPTTPIRTSADGAALPRAFLCAEGNAGKPPAGELPVFGIAGSNGSTRVSLLPGMWAETVYYLNLRTASLGQVVYTDPYREWSTLVFCGRSYVCPGKAHDHSVGVDGSRGFWSYCKDRLRIMSGVSAVQIPPLHQGTRIQICQSRQGLVFRRRPIPVRFHARSRIIAHPFAPAHRLSYTGRIVNPSNLGGTDASCNQAAGLGGGGDRPRVPAVQPDLLYHGQDLDPGVLRLVPRDRSSPTTPGARPAT